MKLYNSLTKQVKDFKPQKDGEISIYSCGPTVYERAHIGNLSSFMYADTLKRAKSDDKASIRDALVATNLNTIVGPVAWGKGPVKNVAKTPLVGGQWVKGKKYKYDLIVVNNQTAPNIPVQGKLKLMA